MKYLKKKMFGECLDCHAPLDWRGECTGLTRLYKSWDKDDLRSSRKLNHFYQVCGLRCSADNLVIRPAKEGKMNIYENFYNEIANAYMDHDGDLSRIGSQAIASLERVRLSLLAMEQSPAIKHCDFCGIDTFDDTFGRCSVCQNRRR